MLHLCSEWKIDSRVTIIAHALKAMHRPRVSARSGNSNDLDVSRHSGLWDCMASVVASRDPDKFDTSP